MHEGFGLERLVSKHRDRALLSGRTVEAVKWRTESIRPWRG